MSIQILSRIPEEFTLSDTIKFKKTLGDFPFSEGWTLTYYFVKKDGTTGELFNVVATQHESTEDYLITIATAKTSGRAAGDYSWRAKVSKAGETSTVEMGSLTLNPSYTAEVDTRSDAAKILAAIDAARAGTASPEQKRMKVRDREIENFDPAGLLKERTYYAQIVAAEEAAEKLALGLANPNKIRTRLMNN